MMNTIIKDLMVITAAACVSINSAAVWAACNTNIPLSKPDSIYAVNGDGTVTDSETGLMWQQCSLGLHGTGCTTGAATTFTWKAAMEAAQTANAGSGSHGYTDWRLPSTSELGSLVENACNFPAINTTAFPATVSGVYWSASPYFDNSDNAWFVYFNYGYEYTDFKSSNHYVRLVRDSY